MDQFETINDSYEPCCKKPRIDNHAVGPVMSTHAVAGIPYLTPYDLINVFTTATHITKTMIRCVSHFYKKIIDKHFVDYYGTFQFGPNPG